MRPGMALMGGLITVLGLVGEADAQSLFRESGPGATLFIDHRARAVNDIVTILVVEQSSASRSGNTDLSKDTSVKASVNQFPTVFDSLARRVAKPIINPLLGFTAPSDVAKNELGIDLSAQSAHKGKGTIDSSDKVTGQLSARVVKVLDNGNLLIEGRRAVLVNNETQIITVSGIIRPQDVTGANTVLSSQMADAEVQMVGRGLLADQQRPGLLYRILNWLSLF